MKNSITMMACTGMLFVFNPVVQSQTPSPDQWKSFVETNKTVLVSDTFRMQRFENRLPDNWAYTTSGNAVLIDASVSGAQMTSGGKLMKMKPGSKMFFSAAFSPAHQSVKGGLSYTGNNLMKGENLNVTLYEEEKTDAVVVSRVGYDNFNIDLKPVFVNRSIYGIDFHVSEPASNTKNGYYCVDSVYLFGKIPLYSLFQGKSFWNDTTAWSDLPAERHRHALVKGEVLVTSNIHCDLVDLSGKINIEQGKTLSLQELNIHEASSVIQNEGDLLLKGKISLYRTFPEKGVWYFVSFPFDVYADGIDPDFTLKDDMPNSGGNFIYALTYNGESRNDGKTIRSNWDVLPEVAAWSNTPVFEKNKGYLLAIDKQASETTIRFTSRTGAIPAVFGRSGEIEIDIPYEVDEENNHGGWYLCGNPLPAPLHVSKLQHPDLDGYIYVFNGESYTPIPADGNYTLPPYSAFFVKAERSVVLTIGATKEHPETIALSGMLALRGGKVEPFVNTPTNNAPILDKAYYQMQKTSFLITNAPENGTVTIFNATGQHVFSTRFASGESKQIALPEQQGFYILLLQTHNRRAKYKFIR